MDYTEVFEEIKNKDDACKIEIIKREISIENNEKFFKKYYNLYPFETILCFMTLNKGDGFYFVRKKGCFRLVDKSELCPNQNNIIERLNKLIDEFDCDKANIKNFFEAKIKLWEIFKKIFCEVDKYIKGFYNYQKESVFLDLYSICASYIVKRLGSEEDRKRTNDLYDLKDTLGYVDCCNAVSLVFELLCKNINSFTGSNKRVYGSVDLDKCVVVFNKIVKLREYEAYLDYFNFSVEKDKNCFSFKCQDEYFLKSIDAGYIFNKFSRFTVLLKNTYKSQISFEEMISSEKLKNLDDIVKCHRISDQLGDRYAYSINGGACAMLSLIDGIKDETLIIEDLAEYLVFPPEELQTLKISNNIQMSDIVVFKRIFTIWGEKIKKLNITQDKLFFNSVSQKMSYSDFESMLIHFYDDKEKVNELINVFDFNNEASVKDLLYCPFLKIGDDIYYSPLLCEHSYMERNAINIAKKRSTDDESFKVINNRAEYLEEKLKNICEKYRIDCKTNLTYSYNTRQGEIDALIYDDNNLLIIECKSPIPSTNSFELRSVFNYLQKGAEQLDLSFNALSDKTFYDKKMQEWGITTNKRKIYTLLCCSQREFSGYTLGNHPIRSLRDLIAFIEDEKMVIGEKNIGLEIKI